MALPCSAHGSASMRILRPGQVKVNAAIRIVSLQEFWSARCSHMAAVTSSAGAGASLNQVLDLALDLSGLRLEERALPEDFVQEGVVLQFVPACGTSWDSTRLCIAPRLHDAHDRRIDHVLALHWSLENPKLIIVYKLYKAVFF